MFETVILKNKHYNNSLILILSCTFLRKVYEVTMEDYSVSSGPSCCSAPPPPPPPPLPLQGNLLIGMQAATWSRGALAPSLKGPAPRSSLFSFFLLVCPNALSLLPPLPRAAVTISARHECWRARGSGGARLTCHFRRRRFQNRASERPLVREAESTLRFVGDPERACSAAVNAGGGLLLKQIV